MPFCAYVRFQLNQSFFFHVNSFQWVSPSRIDNLNFKVSSCLNIERFLHCYALWLAKKSRAAFFTIRRKTKTNFYLPARVFPRLAPATCICHWFWLVHWIVCEFCDWSELLYTRLTHLAPWKLYFVTLSLLERVNYGDILMYFELSSLSTKSYGHVTIQMKPLCPYFCVVPFVFHFFYKMEFGIFLEFWFFRHWFLEVRSFNFSKG